MFDIKTHFNFPLTNFYQKSKAIYFYSIIFQLAILLKQSGSSPQAHYFMLVTCPLFLPAYFSYIKALFNLYLIRKKFGEAFFLFSQRASNPTDFDN